MNEALPLPLCGLILAGGLARRMEGQDKGLLDLAGEPLIAHVIRSLAPQVERLCISANRNLHRYEQFGYPVLQDARNDYAGPLAGLQRALQSSADMPVLVVPCDAPLLPATLAQRLYQCYQEATHQAVIPHDGTRLQSLFGLYPPWVAESLKYYLDTGHHSVKSWVSALPHRVVDCSDQAPCFLNINTLADLHKAATVLKSSRPC